ncbi:MAG TPA: MFS transporter [Candidatus Angelobacter sp.]|nr:MFS transporter [Candidatus Angelobacter sp.]
MRSKLYPAFALFAFTALNFFNYIDRSVLPAVQPLIQSEFHRSDADLGWLTSVFFFFYMVTAPIIGLLADRYQRKFLVAGGAILWSGATFLTALVHDYNTLLIRHTLVGIGEATFVTIAPSVIADLFPEYVRGRMLSIFYIAIPAGTACGYLLGGWLGPTHGWRAPFLIAGIPGFLLAVLVLFMREPERGSSDQLLPTPERATLAGLAHNPAFWTASLGMAMLTFAQGGVAVWMPTFLSRMRGLSLLQANNIFGGMLLFNGIVATLIGGWLGDRLLRRTKSAYYLVSGAGMFLALPFIAIAIFQAGRIMYPAILIGSFFLLLNTGPLNAAMINSVAAPIRATAIAVNLFTIHILGDVPSPPLMGLISDHSSLEIAFLPVIAACAISGAILMFGMRFAPVIPLEERTEMQAAH